MALVALWCGLLAGCGSNKPGEAGGAGSEPRAPRVGVLEEAPPPIPLQLTDVTRAAGVTFRHYNGAFGAKLMPETLGSGVAWLDFDSDGDQDLYFVQSRDWTREEARSFQSRSWSRAQRTAMTGALRFRPRAAPRQTFGVLYRNDGGTFRDVTRGSGLERLTYGMGATVGDFDNDGRPDLYLTGYPHSFLFRNTGQGRFQDVSQQFGVRVAGWSTAAAWVDFNCDGWLDLFVGRYVAWSPRTDVFQSFKGPDKVYSSPSFYAGLGGQLFQSVRGQRFMDVSVRAGINVTDAKAKAGGAKARHPLRGRTLGVALCDYNNDYWPDLVVTNDLTPNNLFRNNKNGTFSEVALRTGIALSSTGRARAGMGVDAADIDHSDRESVVIGNFSGEMLGLYKNTSGQFEDIAPQSHVGNSSLRSLTFGCAFADMDNDGWPDMLVANGHVDALVAQHDPEIEFEQHALFYRNLGRSEFREIGQQSGDGLRRRIVGRGLSTADYDLDGDMDAVFSANNSTPLLVRNDGGNANHSLRLVLRGTRSNRDAIGTIVKVRLGSSGLRRMARSSSSYLSQSELPLTLGLGTRAAADEIGIRWPSGSKTILRDVAANQIITVQEGRGIVSQQPFARSAN